ncbi:MAG TPA: dihydrodipicolinate synthase family protein [Candidatus Limnocylindria bacterium]|jgi:4-hydroxy-tetrahydrodipicolinate synthase|nr:dihydrodipicolinate synthase family protein [Candidatus Limnocylindria bacterium]
MNLHGIHPIVVTPFTDEGAIDHAGIASLTAFLLAAEVDGLAILGVMGEADKLSGEEREAVIRSFRAALPAGKNLVVGTGAPGTDVAIAFSRRAIELGADALLVAPPPVQNDQTLFTYYQRIGAAVSVPIVLHDYPTSTGIVMTPELIARLANEVPHVDYIKLEDPPTGPKITRVQQLARPDFKVLGAYGGLFALEELDRGAVGIMTGFAYPELLVRLYRAHTAGDAQEAERLFYGMLPLIRFEFQPKLGISLRKHILKRRGVITSTRVRHPGAEADLQTLRELERIEAHLAKQGLLELAPVAR